MDNLKNKPPPETMKERACEECHKPFAVKASYPEVTLCPRCAIEQLKRLPD